MGGCRRLFYGLPPRQPVNSRNLLLKLALGADSFAYVMGISMYAKGESQKREAPARVSIVFLFSSPLLALAGLIHWHQIDPIRQTLINLTGLFAAWIAFRSIMEMRSGRDGAIAKGYPICLQAFARLTRWFFLSTCPPLSHPVCAAYHLLFCYKRSLRRLEPSLIVGFMPSTYSTIRKNIRLDCTHRVFFTKDSFSMANDTLSEILQPHLEGRRTKALVYLDEGLLDGNPNLPECIESYFRGREERLNLVTSPVFIKGGEEAKNDWSLVERIWADLKPACDVSALLCDCSRRRSRLGPGRFCRVHRSSGFA